MATFAVWAAAEAILSTVPDVTFAWPNQRFAAPANGEGFVRVGARAAEGEPAEMGANPIWVERGAIECTIVVPAGTGTMKARGIADSIIAAFRAATRDRPTGAVIWDGFELQEGEASEDGAYWVLHLQIFFRTQTVLTG
ncbi:phage tail terminator-like protein [Rhodovarius lipocyclicus]|uniref:phage tail terminator-like protein n=1 Tax=Rhodovarius lipocyclicus TaxID=268410 RepID=UPI00135A5FD5|nr:phage tail terminator-like protein [Rhodovarius lipocyclicus]